MARENKLGSSFLGLDLDKSEEQFMKTEAKRLTLSSKAFLRYLVRIYIKQQNEK